MRGVHKTIALLFFIGFLGLIITSYQNCGGQSPQSSLCFGPQCGQINQSSTGNNNTQPTPTPNSNENLIVSSTNSSKLFINSPKYCTPLQAGNEFYSTCPQCCAAQISWATSVNVAIYVYHQSIPANKSVFACASTNGSNIAGWVFPFTDGSNYVFEMYETTCPGAGTPAQQQAHIANLQPVATLTMRKQ
ncbi:MAG: hypothetical protein IPM57_07765 [Oligoflexia bacterium]|nr:hypothetical protein [Oligoflexia bacterium]